jgi:hypothetical protein
MKPTLSGKHHAICRDEGYRKALQAARGRFVQYLK